MKITKVILLSLILACFFSSISFAQEQKVKFPYLCVRGIIFDKEQPLAIVNEKFIGVGQSILGVKVNSITEAQVEFEYEGSIFVKEVGQDCFNVVGPADTTVYLGDKREDLKEIITRIAKLPTAKDAKTRREVEELQSKLVNYFRQNTTLIVVVVLLLFILPYIYYAVTLQMIATKTGTESAWLAWIPIANIHLECKIAGKPGWWLLLRLFTVLIPFAGPIITAIITVIVWMAISEVRRKPTWLGILSIIPILNLFLLGYLAFSKGVTLSEKKKEEEEKSAIDIGIAKQYNR